MSMYLNIRYSGTNCIHASSKEALFSPYIVVLYIVYTKQ